MTAEEEWIDVETVARLLGFHPNTVDRLIRDGKLPALRFPVRIRSQDLDTLFERCRIKPGELRHLNAYASGAHRSTERSTTRADRPDRRYGARSKGADLDSG